MSSDSHNNYVLLTPNERQAQLDKILAVWNDFLTVNDPNLSKEDIFINQRMLAEVIERVSKRKYYYAVFHKLLHISEFKEAALFVFWITKLKPFTVIREDSPLCASVNELFCVHLILSTFEKIHLNSGASNYTYPSKALLNDFIYGLKYQDFTKESLIVYIEVLATACGLHVFDYEPLS
jgi:hypothetical protein